MHGWSMTAEQFLTGEDARNFEGFAEGNIAPHDARIILPQAPRIYNPVGGCDDMGWFGHCKTGWGMWYAWFPFLTPNKNFYVKGHPELHGDQNAQLKTRDMIMKTINSEIEQLPNKDSKRLLVGGFSQGCYMANAILVTYPGPDPLGGVFCASGMIGLREDYFNKTKEARNAQRQTPYLAYHGLRDDIVDFENAEWTYQYYVNDLYKDQPKSQFEIHTDKYLYHHFDRRELRYIEDWIRNKLE